MSNEYQLPFSGEEITNHLNRGSNAIVWKGDWAGGQNYNYKKNDLVKQGSQLYLCTLDCNGFVIPEDNPDTWQTFSTSSEILAVTSELTPFEVLYQQSINLNSKIYLVHFVEGMGNIVFTNLNILMSPDGNSTIGASATVTWTLNGQLILGTLIGDVEQNEWKLDMTPISSNAGTSFEVHFNCLDALEDGKFELVLETYSSYDEVYSAYQAGLFIYATVFDVDGVKLAQMPLGICNENNMLFTYMSGYDTIDIKWWRNNSPCLYIGAFYSSRNTGIEEWTFTLEDGSTVEKRVILHYELR